MFLKSQSMKTYFIGNIECRLWCRYKKPDKISLPAAYCGLLSAPASAEPWDQSTGCAFHLGRIVPALVRLSLPEKAGFKTHIYHNPNFSHVNGVTHEYW